MRLKSKILNFKIWRAGQSVDWDCTAEDIAADVGCSSRSVHNHVKKSGWRLRSVGESGSYNRQSVDRFMESRSSSE